MVIGKQKRTKLGIVELTTDILDRTTTRTFFIANLVKYDFNMWIRHETYRIFRLRYQSEWSATKGRQS